MSARYQFLAYAKSRFAFLEGRGFRITSEREGTYASFKDGFDLRYCSDQIVIVVQYYEMEFQVLMRRGAAEAPYLFLDLNLRANASGLAGVMFPHDKLTDIIDRVASDIEQHYDAVLRGDPTVWHKIEKLLAAPQEKKGGVKRRVHCLLI